MTAGTLAETMLGENLPQDFPVSASNEVTNIADKLYICAQAESHKWKIRK